MYSVSIWYKSCHLWMPVWTPHLWPLEFLLLSARVANLHTCTLEKGKGFLTYSRWCRSIIPVNMTYVKLCSKLLGSVRLNCFEPIRKIIFVLEIWNSLRKAGNWLACILLHYLYQINWSFPSFTYSAVFSNWTFLRFAIYFF